MYHNQWSTSLTQGSYQYDKIVIFNEWIRDCADDDTFFFTDLTAYDDNKDVIPCAHRKEYRQTTLGT